jgi:putative pyridoxal-dependent aspartate 1-decarboxylase
MISKKKVDTGPQLGNFANFDTLRTKYFLSQENEQECARWLQLALREAAAFVQNSDGHKIHSDVTLPHLEKLFPETSMPDAGDDLPDTFRKAVDVVMRHSVRVASPYYVGHMSGVTPYFSLIADLLICALNQNVVKIETALSASFVEGQTLAWLHRLVYGQSEAFYRKTLHAPESAFGNVTSGGTMGNLTALAVARNLRFPDAARKGLSGALAASGHTRLVLVASRRVHYSVRKAASILGIGEDNVVEIPVEPFENRIDVGALEATLDSLKAEGACVLALIGVAGSTETGGVDDLLALARLAKTHNTWFHVDAAWGGPLLLSRTHSPLLSGIEAADSVVMDGHKLFYLPMSHGCVLFRDVHALDALRHTARYIIRTGSVDLGRTSLEGSRRFDSFKMWFFLRVLGRRGFEALVDNAVSLGHAYGRLVEKHPSFQLTSRVSTNILTYRYVPPEWKAALERLRMEACPENAPPPSVQAAVAFVTSVLNDVNVELQKRQRQAGRSFVSRTTLESVFAGTDTVVLRAVPFNPLTTEAMLVEILAEQETLGRDVFRKRWKKLRMNAPEGFETILAEH